MRNQPGRFETLDAMRGVAAIIVTLFHGQYTMPWRVREYLFQSGYLAVDLFFVLSGFVIALSYDGKFASGMRLGQFIKVRAIRLLPMVWIGVAIGSVFLATLNQFSLTQIAAIVALNAFLLPCGALLFASNGPLWSLFFEGVINVVYAATWRWLSIRMLGAIALISSVSAVVAVLVNGNLGGGTSLGTAGVGIARVGFSFTLGVLLWRTRDRWAAFVPRIPAPLILAVVAGCLWPPFGGSARAVYDLVFVFVFSPLLVMLGSATEPTGRGVLIAETLAAISYPMYAIHRPIQHLVEQLSTAAGVSGRIPAMIAFALVIPASWLLARYYDEPVRAWLRRKPAALRMDRGVDLR